MSGSVVNVMAMLTGNASGMVSSFGAGGEAAKAFKETYEKTAGATIVSSKAIADALEKEAATAKATSAAAQEAVGKAAISRDIAAAQAAVAADKETAAQARAAKAAEDAAAAKIHADATGTAAAEEAATAQAAAAERAANAATLATAQKIKAAAAAADASSVEAAKVAEAMRAEEGAIAASVRAAEVGAAQKKAAYESSMTAVNKLAAGTAIAAAIVGGVSLEMAGKFEASTQLLVTAGGETAANLQTVRDGILQVAESTGVGVEKLAEGMYTVEKAGMRGADGLTLLKAAAQAAVAENVDMSTMTTALTSVMTTYGLKASDSVSVTNQMVTAAGASKTTMQEFAGSLSTVLPIAQSAHLSFDQIGGAIATMTQHGTSANEATQELRNAIQNLLAPNNVAISEMNQLGISSQDVSQNLGSRGLTGTLDMMREKVLSSTDGGLVLLDMMRQSASAANDMGLMIGHMDGPLKGWSQNLLDGTMTAKDYNKNIHTLGIEGSTTGQQFEVLAKKSNGFNDEIKKGSPAAQTYVQAMEKMMGGTTGLQTMLMLTGDNMASFVTRTQEVGDAANQTGDDISTNAATQATLAAETKRVEATFQALAIELGTVLMPVVKDFLGGLLDTVKWLQENSDVAAALGIVLGVVAGSVMAISVATWAVTAATEAWTLIVPVATAGMIGLDVAMDANPIGLVVLAIEALIAILVGLVIGFKAAYENIGWFHDAVDGAATGIRQHFELLGASAKLLADNFGSFSREASANIHQFSDESSHNLTDFNNSTRSMFNDFFSNTGGMISDWVGNSVGMFSDFGNSTGGMISDWVSNSLGMFGDFGNSTGGMFADWVSNSLGMFGDFFATVGNGWRGFWKDPIGETKSFVATTWADLSAWDMQTGGMFLDFFTNTGGMIADWAVRSAGMFADFHTNTAGMIADWGSNSRGMFADFFTNTANGFMDWNQGASRNVNDFVRTTGGMYADWGRNSLGMFGDFFSNTGGMFSDWANSSTASTDAMSTGSQDHINQMTTGGGDDLGSFFGTTGGMFADWASNSLGMMNDWGSNSRGMFSDWQQQTTGETRTFTDNAIRDIDNFNRTTNGMFSDFVSNTGGMIGDWVSNSLGMFSDFGTNMAEAARQAVEGFVNGLTGGIQDISRAAMDMGTTAINAIRDVLGIHSPSRVMFEDGGNTAQGFADGVTARSPVAVEAVANMARDTADAGKAGGEATAKAFGSGLKSLQDYAGDALATSIMNVTKAATTGRDAQFSFGKSVLDAAASAAKLKASLGGDMSSTIDQVTGDFNKNTAAGQSANQMMVGVRDHGLAVAKAFSTDVTKGSGDVTQAMKDTATAMQQTAKDMGYTDEQAQALTRGVLGIPPGVDINTWMDDQAKVMAEKTKGATDQIPRKIGIDIQVYGMDKILAAQAAGDNLAANSMLTANKYADGGAYRWNGGEVSHLAKGGFPGGGWVTGGGTETSDGIATMLSNHEFVVKAASAAKYGPSMMKEINDGTWQPSVRAAAAPAAWAPTPTATAAPAAGGGGDVTIVLEVPELGGRLNARIQSISKDSSTSIIEALNRATRNSAGVPAGGY